MPRDDPAFRARLLGDPRPAMRRLTRRHRRPAAALLAGTSVLVALTVLRSAAAPAPAAGAPASPTSPAALAGEVLVPVLLASSAIASSLDVGDVVDVVALGGRETATASVVAPRARVVELPSAGSALSGSSSAVVLLAVPEPLALPLSAASAGGGVTVVIRPN